MAAVPTIRHAITDKISEFSYILGQADANPEIPYNFDFRVFNGTSGISFPVEYMRNLIVQRFLETDYDALWFIDSDTRPTHESVKLLHVDADIVGGIYPIPETNKGSYVWSVYDWKGFEFKPKMLPKPDENPIVDCDAIGTGAMIIRRKVLEDPRMRHTENGDGPPPIFQTLRYPSGKCRWTDDLDFCKRARALGYTMKCHTGIRWGHVKNMDMEYPLEMAEKAFAAGVDYGASEHGIIDCA